MTDWLTDQLACPRDRTPLTRDGDSLRCTSGHSYPVVDGIPILLVDEARPTHKWHTAETREAVEAWRRGGRPAPGGEGAGDPGEGGREQAGGGDIDAHVQQIVAGTCGNLYLPVVGKLHRYPIPDLRLPPGGGARLLDVGCNWGRWCVAAARLGYRPVGVDPSIGGVRAARRVAERLGVEASYLVADGRFLPFRDGAFDVVFSYGVLQHFGKPDARATLAEMARVRRAGGRFLVQMPNMFGVRSLYNQARRGFREGKDFDVRYWTPAELERTFAEVFGEAELVADAYFGLGIIPADADLLPRRYRPIVRASEILRRASDRLPPLRRVADSVYLRTPTR